MNGRVYKKRLYIAQTTQQWERTVSVAWKKKAELGVNLLIEPHGGGSASVWIIAKSKKDAEEAYVIFTALESPK